MILDRFFCEKPTPESNAKNLSCIVKYISRNNLKIDVNWYFTKPVDNAWANFDFYYKFNSITYQKFPINLWLNLCEFLKGNRFKTFGLSWMLGKLMPFSNMRNCPLQGLQYVTTSNFSMDNFTFKESLMPSGKYRVDIVITDGDRIELFRFQIYGSISDHRLEVF